MISKLGVDISFAQGLDTKTDPKRVAMGNFVSLSNAIFTKGGLLQKRNGYEKLSVLPNNSFTYATVLNDNLTAVGTSIAAFNRGNDGWVSKGQINPLSLNTLALLRNNFNQVACDSAVASNGLVCTAYIENNGSTLTNKYVIADSITGQNISAPVAIPVTSGTVSLGMRVYILGSNFIILFTNTISSTPHLQYIAISIINPTNVTANATLAASYVPSSTSSYDAFVANNTLYFAYNTTSGGQAVQVNTLSKALAVGTPVSLSSFEGTAVSVTADITEASPIIYVSFYDISDNNVYTAVYDQSLNLILNPMNVVNGSFSNITSAAQNGSCTVFVEVVNNYGYDSSIASNYIQSFTLTPLFTTTKSVFSSGASSITVASAAGLALGMYLVDNTTSGNFAPGTTVTMISGTTLHVSANPLGNSASSPGDTLSFATGTSVVTIIRSMGLASKAFIINGTIYFLAAYQSTYQPTYFLINASVSTQNNPSIAAKLAYQNGRGYLPLGLPNVSIIGATAYIPYIYKDLIQAANKDTNVSAGTQIAGIYAQTGVNLANFTIGTQNFDTAEIAQCLHFTGGFLSMYDGYLPVEHNFFLYPDSVEAAAQVDPAPTAATSSTSPILTSVSSVAGITPGMAISGTGIAANSFVVAVGTTTVTMNQNGAGTHATETITFSGNQTAQKYYYQVTYEWSDNNGNIYRSAPSIPVTATTSSGNTSVVINIPTLRATMKTANVVKIVIYRWSTAQQIYYQTTSISIPLQNSTTTDYVTFIDANSDAEILGNNIIYTNGGVVEDINAPASNLLALFDTRLWLVDAEDQNLLYFSKQVIESTPVEMSDLFTMYIPPSTSTEGTTGPITAIFPMDDKLIICKRNALLYINGTGPDNAGANSNYSSPIFVTSSVGCSNQASIVLMPTGLMFQSNKGIWLLDRGLGTTYIGAPVENFTQNAIVINAVSIPDTNQVRFLLDSGIWLMYDYYYGEWSTFSGIPALSSTIFEGLHTFIDKYGRVFQETQNTYLDGANPVLMSFTTGPLRLGDLQNYQRAFFFYLLGTYFTPHKLICSISYDYEESPSQTIPLSPINYSTPYGNGSSQSPYGQGNPYGGPSNIEQFRVFLKRQRCQALAITLQEVYDGSYAVPSGQGFSLSGINMVMGFKGQFPTVPTNISFG